MANLEIETTLAICSETPEQFADEVAGITEIEAFFLVHQPELAIHDVYLDLAGGRLHARGLGLRLRVINDVRLLTLKGKPDELDGGGIRREEIELPWSAESLEVLAARLADDGITVSFPRLATHDEDPLYELSRAGFLAVQTRDTRRRPRGVIVRGETGRVVAELVVDAVTYHLTCGDVRHHEVEIELKIEGGGDVLVDLPRALLSRWPADLRQWSFGKKSTGKAVESLAVERDLADLLSATGNLRPDAYDLILGRIR